jgi:hypothetical protein
MSSVMFLCLPADGSVGTAQVARFPGLVQGAQSGSNMLWEVWADAALFKANLMKADIAW